MIRFEDILKMIKTCSMKKSFKFRSKNQDGYYIYKNGKVFDYFDKPVQKISFYNIIFEEWEVVE